MVTTHAMVHPTDTADGFYALAEPVRRSQQFKLLASELTMP